MVCRWSRTNLLGPGTHTTGTRDQKVLSMCILEHLRTTNRVVRVISRFVGTPRSGICYRLGPGTHPTGTRDQKVLTMCILEHLGTTYRVVWGFSRFIQKSLCILF